MTSLVEKTKSQRKTFTLPTYIVKELEEYAKLHNKKQSQIIAKALEEYLSKQKTSKKIEKRINALQNIIAIAPKGSLKQVDIKDILKDKAKNYE